METQNIPLEVQTSKSPKGKIIAALIAVVLAVCGGVYYYAFYNADNTPPSLTPDSQFKGFIGSQEHGFAVYEEADKAKFTENKTRLEAAATASQPVETAVLKKGVNIVYSNTDLKFGDARYLIDPAVKSFVIAMYSPESSKFYIWPQNNYYTTGTTPASIGENNTQATIIPAGTGFFVVAEADAKMYGVNSGDKLSTKDQKFCSNKNAGWYLVAAKAAALKDLFSTGTSTCETRIESVWVKYPENPDIFKSVPILNIPTYTLTNSKLVWVKLNEKAAAPAMQPASPVSSGGGSTGGASGGGTETSQPGGTGSTTGATSGTPATSDEIKKVEDEMLNIIIAFSSGEEKYESLTKSQKTDFVNKKLGELKQKVNKDNDHCTLFGNYIETFINLEGGDGVQHIVSRTDVVNGKAKLLDDRNKNTDVIITEPKNGSLSPAENEGGKDLYYTSNENYSGKDFVYLVRLKEMEENGETVQVIDQSLLYCLNVTSQATTPIDASGTTPSVILSASNPPKTATFADNTSANTLLKVDFTANRVATITGFKVHKTGTAKDFDVEVAVWVDSKGYGNVTPFTKEYAVVSFESDPITITAGTTKTVTFKVNLKANMGGATLAIGLTTNKDIITAESVNVTGSFPLNSNEFTISGSASSTPEEPIKGTSSETLGEAGLGLKVDTTPSADGTVTIKVTDNETGGLVGSVKLDGTVSNARDTSITTTAGEKFNLEDVVFEDKTTGEKTEGRNTQTVVLPDNTVLVTDMSNRVVNVQNSNITVQTTDSTAGTSVDEIGTITIEEENSTGDTPTIVQEIPAANIINLGRVQVSTKNDTVTLINLTAQPVTATTFTQIVNPCGNGTPDTGEECDTQIDTSGNCDATCHCINNTTTNNKGGCKTNQTTAPTTSGALLNQSFGGITR